MKEDAEYTGDTSLQPPDPIDVYGESRTHLTMSRVAMTQPLQQAFLVDVLDATTARARIVQRIIGIP